MAADGAVFFGRGLPVPGRQPTFQTWYSSGFRRSPRVGGCPTRRGSGAGEGGGSSVSIVGHRLLADSQSQVRIVKTAPSPKWARCAAVYGSSPNFAVLAPGRMSICQQRWLTWISPSSWRPTGGRRPGVGQALGDHGNHLLLAGGEAVGGRLRYAGVGPVSAPPAGGAAPAGRAGRRRRPPTDGPLILLAHETAAPPPGGEDAATEGS